MDVDIDGEGFIDCLEEIAEAHVIGYVIVGLFYVVSWPFVSVSRLMVFMLSLGRVSPNFKDSFKNSFITMLSMVLFLFVLFWCLINVVPLI